MECRKQPEFLFFGKAVIGGNRRYFDPKQEGCPNQEFRSQEPSAVAEAMADKVAGASSEQDRFSDVKEHRPSQHYIPMQHWYVQAIFHSRRWNREISRCAQRRRERGEKNCFGLDGWDAKNILLLFYFFDPMFLTKSGVVPERTRHGSEKWSQNNDCGKAVWACCENTEWRPIVLLLVIRFEKREQALRTPYASRYATFLCYSPVWVGLRR
jgi:hypothetical protein